MRCARLMPRGETVAGCRTGAGGRRKRSRGGRGGGEWGWIYLVLQRSGREAGWGGVSPESGAVSVLIGKRLPSAERLGSASLAESPQLHRRAAPA